MGDAAGFVFPAEDAVVERQVRPGRNRRQRNGSPVEAKHPAFVVAGFDGLACSEVADGMAFVDFPVNAGQPVGAPISVYPAVDVAGS